MKTLNSIMLIDDDETTNYYNQYIIKKIGAAEHVIVATNGKKALDYLNNIEEGSDEFIKPNLIFLDINMPVMDGFEFLDAYKKIDESKKADILICFLTSSTHETDIIKAKELNEIVGYENKPMDEEKLKAIMEKYFGE